MEDQYRVIYPEREFMEEMEDFHVVGKYIRRQLMGCIQCAKRTGDERFNNMTKYLWRVFFEKSEELLLIGIYHKDGVYYIGSADNL